MFSMVVLALTWLSEVFECLQTPKKQLSRKGLLGVSGLCGRKARVSFVNCEFTVGALFACLASGNAYPCN